MTRDEAIALLSTARGVNDADKLLRSVESVTLEFECHSLWCAEPEDPKNSHIGISVGLGEDNELIYDAIVTDSSAELNAWKACFHEDDYEDEQPVGDETPAQL
jgi:hypothetical protein